METFNRCLICQAEVCIGKGSLNNLELCQKFVTLASRYYNIDFPDNLHKTLKLNQLKCDTDCAQFVSCDDCSEKINSFCKIYKELSLLQIQLNASARKITQLMKDVQLTQPSNSIENNGPTPESRNIYYFRNQLYSKVAQQLPHVKLRRLEIYNASIFKQENHPFYSPLENENSDNEDESDSGQMDHIHGSADSCDAVPPPPPPPTNSGTEKTHCAKKFGKVKMIERFQEEASTEFENLVVDGSSIGAAGNTVEMLKSLPQGSVLIVPGTTTDLERRHKCRFCEKTFETKRNKDNHENVHLQKYRCRFCNRRFSFRFRMKVHERTHTGIKPFKCSVCAETFREKRAGTDHVWRIHKGNGEVIEDLNYEQENNLVESKIERNLVPIKATPNFEDAEKPFKCPICLKGFATGKSLTRHQRIHKKPLFNCDVCGAAFPDKWKMENHKISHTGERPYLCPICFRTFSRHVYCKTHQRNVHKIANGVVINTKVSGVKVVRASDLSLPKENQNVTPGNQAEHGIQGTENLHCTNGDEDNFILPETEQEVPMDLEKSEVKIEDTQLEDPLGDL